jgi:CHAT domain-containing protein/Tfp pilus assembly protein PilF
MIPAPQFPVFHPSKPRSFRLLPLAQYLCLFSLLSIFFFGCAPLKTASVSPGKVSATPSQRSPANVYAEKGSNAWQIGAFEQAVLSWKQAAQLYEEEGSTEKQSETLDKLSQAYLALGHLHTSLKTLQKARTLAEKAADQRRLASVSNHLANVYLALGNCDTALDSLRKGLEVSKKAGDFEISASILNNLGNVYSAQKAYEKAVHAYQRSLALSKKGKNHLLSATAFINCAAALMRNGHYRNSKTFLDEALAQLHKTEDTHDKAYGLINIGLACSRLGKHLHAERDKLLALSYKLFSQASAIARKIGDHRALSYALGSLGRMYENEHRYDEALNLTRRAAFAAQQVPTPESLYRWQWQTGRILRQLGKIDDALASYRRAVYTLQTMRHEMDKCYGNVGSSFRKTAGRVCFELVDLLLQRAATTNDSGQRHDLLTESRDIVELLRVYELRNYFKDDCVDAARFRPVRLDTISRNTAVIYPILLPDRTVLLVSLPSGLKQFQVKAGKEQITREVRSFRKTLEKRTTREFLPHAQRLYNYLVRPVAQDLCDFGIHTLVFVPGGPLRTIPTGALHDGERFLIEKYATAVTPGLDLTDPRPLDRKNIKVLVAGLWKSVQGFPALPYAKPEMEEITSLYPSESLFNEHFSSSNLEKALRNKDFTVLHIASHGEFRSDVGKTFLLTFDGKLSLNRLDEYVGLLQFREKPLELLTLSACDTAAGDDLAALGIAGIAIKAGAKSALATLWQVNDLATSLLVEEFYRQIRMPSVTRAEALRRAKLKLLHDPRYEHPGYWSPFLMINNWL